MSDLKGDAVEEAVRRFYFEDADMQTGDCIIVAVSGGPDSSALLHLTHALSQQVQLNLQIAHFNHRLRKHSGDDANFVREKAVGLGIPITIESADEGQIRSRKGTGMEDAARRARYDFLERTRSRLDGRFIAIAHNLEDQAETVLLRLFRGTGTTGASAMQQVNGKLIRPLLGVSREAILDYCRRHDVSYCTDPTNAEAITDRNRLRLNIMPELRRIWPRVDAVLARDAQVFAQEALALEWAAKTAMNFVRSSSHGNQVEISRTGLRSLPSFVTQLVLRRAAMKVGRSQPPSKLRLDSVVAFCLSANGGGRISLGDGVEVIRGYDTVLFKREQDATRHISGSVTLEPPCTVDVPDTETRLSCRILDTQESDILLHSSLPTEDGCRVLVDLNTVGYPLHVRSRRRGDRLCPHGGSSEIMLTQYLTGRRIPSWHRDSVPIVVGPKGIVWVAGHSIDNRHRVTDR